MHPFIHLHTHSHYSLLNALPTIPELVKAAKAAEMPAVALTDNANLYGAIEFYKECEKEGIQPIIGIDAYVAARTRFDKEHGIDNRSKRLVLLAKNNDGYRNLIRLVTRANLEGFYYKPRIDRELIELYAEGMIAIIPSFSGEIRSLLSAGDTERAQETIEWYRNVFGKDLYLEITHHPEIENHEESMERLCAFAKQEEVPLVAAHDTYYLKKDDHLARETMIKIQSGNIIEETSSFDEARENFSFISVKEANSLFKKTPEALENTRIIADQCLVKLELGNWVFPKLVLATGATADDSLRQVAMNGMEEKGLMRDTEAHTRLEYELDIIKAKGYAPYFLVVSDLLRFAHDQGILTNVRGSVAGSLVTYVTGITKVNPLEYLLPFERFLNPERPSAPDIDMDFADNRRDEVIEYAKKKYGADKVAQIGTFGTMMARAAVRDVARALGHPYSLGDQVAKLIPMGSQGFPMTIEHAFGMEPELKKLYKQDPAVKETIDLAKKIEGKVRHISVHAAGVVISPSALTDFVPLQLDPKGGKIITQFDMHAVEDAGLLKYDFLGIRNLAILADAIKRVRAIHGVEIDIETIPLDDSKTFEMLARGETMGLFQLGGSGMTRYLKELRPTTIHDINAMVALYRPGPMESIPQYIERKYNPSLVSYLDPRLQPILERSYGVITYQDDVLLTAITLAGYSWLEADKLRKAMGKKIPEVMEAEKEKLLKGFVEFGTLSRETAEALWKLIEPFAAYGFNKAHAASYGRVAYQTAYMKANFPVEYMSAVLSAEAGDVEKITEIIDECRRMKIEVLAPDINESYGDFSVVKEKKQIRFGLYSIKNFGEGIADSIIEERKASGPFASLGVFLSRVKTKQLNKKSLEALIKSGALDAFGERGTMLANMDRLLMYIKERAVGAENGQSSLFGAATDTELSLEDGPPAAQEDRLAWEKELLGLYVSGHPLDKHREKLAKQGKTIEDVKKETPEGVMTVIGGLVTELRAVYTKKGDKMAFAKISDFAGSIEVVFFPKLYATQSTILAPDKVLAIKGRYSLRNGDPSLVAEAVKEL